MAHLDIRLLGTFQVTLGGSPVTSFATDKARALLAYLVVESDHPQRRDTLAGLLWPDQPENKARQNLRQTLLYVRQALNDDAPSPAPFLLVDRDTVQFNPASDYHLDAATFQALNRECQRHHHKHKENCLPCLQRMEAIAGLYRGEFLEHFFLADSNLFEEWATLKREWLHREAIDALFTVTNYYTRRGDLSRARHYAWRQVELEPWREEAHRQLIRLLALEGQRSAALAQYVACRRVLAEELGVEPTAETTALYQQIARHLTPSSPHHVTGATVNSGALALSPTPFIGREKELAELAEHIASPDCRLISIVGPGGIGKTRLALHIVEEQRGTFAHGTHIVPLNAVEAPQFIVYAIVEALKFSLQGAQAPGVQLINYLREKEMLLILDNLDHLLEDCTLIEAILDQAPDVMLLVTSRERLNLREEWTYHLKGLTYPDSDSALRPMDLVAENYSALTLFAQCAYRTNRHFTLTGNTLAAAARICHLVEGVPLGIELAAAWSDILDCADIARKIEANVDVLTTSLRNVSARHRSIRASFEYSWHLLTPPEQQHLARLAVFQGSFDLAAATEVTQTPVITLAKLVHKSLLGAETGERYAIHPLLHQYITEKLAQTPDIATATNEHHARHYAQFLAQHETALKTGEQRQALENIGVDIDNVRRACRWAIEHIGARQDIHTGIDVLRASIESLHLFYLLRDWYQEGETFFGEIVAVLESFTTDDAALAEDCQRLLGQALVRQGKCCEFTQLSDKARARFQRGINVLRLLPGTDNEVAMALNGLGYMALIKGEPELAEQSFRESLASYRRTGDMWGVANVLSNLCLLQHRRGNFAQAKVNGLESLTFRRAIDDRRGIAASLNNLGRVQCALGEYCEAEQTFTKSLDICHRMNYRVGISTALNGLCEAAYLQEDFAAAERFVQESLAVCRDIGDHWGVAVALNNLGCIAMEAKAFSRARAYFVEGVHICRSFDIKSSLGNTLSNLGEACDALGTYDEAQKFLHEALTVTRATGNTPILLEVIARLARLAARGGETAAALEWVIVALKHPAMLQEVRDKAEAFAAELTAGLAPGVVAAVQARANSRDLASVVDEVFRHIQ